MTHNPSFETTTKLVARSLGLPSGQLLASLRAAHCEDLPQIITLRREEFGDGIAWDDETYLEWRYRLGRQQPALGELWVTEVGGRIVGMIGVEDIELIHSGRSTRAARLMDLLVAPQVRGTGLGAWLNQAMFRTAPVTLSVGGNPNSMGTVKRLFQVLPPRVTCNCRLDFRPSLERRLGHNLAASVAGRVVNALFQSRRRLTASAVDRSFTVQPIAAFDPSLNGLLARSAPQIDQVAIARSARQLNRRLLQNPRAQYVAHGAYRDGHLLGYIAWRSGQNEDGERWIYVIDWVAQARDRSAVLASLLGHVFREASQRQCSYVSVAVQDTGDIHLLHRHGFVPASRSQDRVAVHAEDPELQAALARAHWGLTGISTDIDML